MLRMTKAGLLALALVMGASSSGLAQGDPEAGDIDVDLPPPKKPAEPESRPRYAGQPGPLRVYGGLNFALGGELKSGETFLGFRPSATLSPTIGLQAGADYVMMDYFALAGEMRLQFWKTSNASGRNLFWDIVVKPRGRYAFSNLPLEVYGALPLGLSVPGLDGSLEGKIGWNLGILAGATYFFNEKMGVNSEIGWVFHQYTFGVENSDGSSSAKMSQFQFLPTANFVYVL